MAKFARLIDKTPVIKQSRRPSAACSDALFMLREYAISVDDMLDTGCAPDSANAILSLSIDMEKRKDDLEVDGKVVIPPGELLRLVAAFGALEEWQGRLGSNIDSMRGEIITLAGALPGAQESAPLSTGILHSSGKPQEEAEEAEEAAPNSDDPLIQLAAEAAHRLGHLPEEHHQLALRSARRFLDDMEAGRSVYLSSALHPGVDSASSAADNLDGILSCLGDRLNHLAASPFEIVPQAPSLTQARKALDAVMGASTRSENQQPAYNAALMALGQLRGLLTPVMNCAADAEEAIELLVAHPPQAVSSKAS